MLAVMTTSFNRVLLVGISNVIRYRLPTQEISINVTNCAETKFHTVGQAGNKKSFIC